MIDHPRNIPYPTSANRHSSHFTELSPAGIRSFLLTPTSSTSLTSITLPSHLFDCDSHCSIWKITSKTKVRPPLTGNAASVTCSSPSSDSFTSPRCKRRSYKDDKKDKRQHRKCGACREMTDEEAAISLTLLFLQSDKGNITGSIHENLGLCKSAPFIGWDKIVAESGPANEACRKWQR